VVVHQHVGVQLAARIEQCLKQQREVTLPIVIIQKAGQAIVAALNDVLRNAGRSSRGCRAIARGSAWACDRDSIPGSFGSWELVCLSCRKVNLTPFGSDPVRLKMRCGTPGRSNLSLLALD